MHMYMYMCTCTCCTCTVVCGSRRCTCDMWTRYYYELSVTLHIVHAHYLYSCGEPHALQNFALCGSFAPHSVQNFCCCAAAPLGGGGGGVAGGGV
jgi:hypothetical protein